MSRSTIERGPVVEIFAKGDIRNTLQSLSLAGGSATALIIEEAEKDDLSVGKLAEHLRLYRRGYKDALAAVAEAFGIVPRRALNDSEMRALGSALPRAHRIDWEEQ